MSAGLGFLDLMSMAEANSKSKQRELQQRQSLRNKEKRVDPKQVKLKVGVQKFLQKKEEEERRKREEANRKKNQLMELRNQDRKATSRVRRMINMTKSANKGVIAEARDCLSEACNEQAGETQPDEDDYGYTSTYANEMYKKMLEKYQIDAKKTPSTGSKLEGPKIHHLKKSSDAKEPERNRGHNKNSQNNLENISEKKKPNKPAPPPPPTFEDLIRLAEAKSKEPVVIKKPPTKVTLEGIEFEFGRPMTSKEKKAYLQEEKLKQRVQEMFSGNTIQNVKDSSKSSSLPTKTVDVVKPKSIPIPKLTTQAKVVDKPIKFQEPPVNQSLKREVNNNFSSGDHYPPRNSGSSKHSKDKPILEYNRKQNSSSTASPPQMSTLHSEFKKPNASSLTNGNASSHASKTTKPNGYSNRETNPTPSKGSSDYLSNSKQRYSEDDIRSKSHRASPTSSSNASFSNRPSVKNPPPKSRPPVDMQEPRYRHERPSDRKDKPPRGRQVIESDEEDYDSEMDDFIDDSDVPPEDISNMIGQMFGYNKRKYVHEESDDDECMESSVAQQMREEARSLRIGVLEDLEDMRMEEEEKKRKAAFLKKRKLK